MQIKIPLEIVALDDNSYHLFVEGYVNGHLCHFIIDTGASKTVFALNEIKDVLEAEPVSQPDIQSAGITATSLDSHTGIINEFRLKDLCLLNMEVVLIDMSPISELYKNFTDKTIGGLIGSDFLLRYKARLDYGSKTLTIKIPKASYLPQ